MGLSRTQVGNFLLQKWSSGDETHKIAILHELASFGVNGDSGVVVLGEDFRPVGLLTGANGRGNFNTMTPIWVVKKSMERVLGIGWSGWSEMF
jgi:hypothetical protein